LKNGGLEQLLDDVGFILKPSFNVEKLTFYSFWNPSIHMHARVCVRKAWSCVCIRICICKACTYVRICRAWACV